MAASHLVPGGCGAPGRSGAHETRGRGSAGAYHGGWTDGVRGREQTPHRPGAARTVAATLLETSNHVGCGAGAGRSSNEARSSAEAPGALPDQKLPVRCSRNRRPRRTRSSEQSLKNSRSLITVSVAVEGRRREREKRCVQALRQTASGSSRRDGLKVTRDKLRTDYSLLASVAQEEVFPAPAWSAPDRGPGAHV